MGLRKKPAPPPPPPPVVEPPQQTITPFSWRKEPVDRTPICSLCGAQRPCAQLTPRRERGWAGMSAHYPLPMEVCIPCLEEAARVTTRAAIGAD